MKVLECRDAGFDCDAVIRADSVEDVLAQAGPHAQDAHGVDVTPQMRDQLAGVIKDG